MERRRLARFAAPVAFLAVITVAALLVRAGLEQGGAQPKGTTSAGTTVTTTTTRTATTAAATTTGKQQHSIRTYTVQSGDTFEAIARKTGTSVAQLEALNPGVDPTALQVGQKIRVK